MVNRILSSLKKNLNISYRIYNTCPNLSDRYYCFAYMDIYISLYKKDCPIEEYQRYEALIVEMLEISNKDNENKYLEYISTHDSLTGVFNRDYFTKQLELQTNAIIIAGDINNLKTTNDVFGHKEGDLLICTVCEYMLKNAKDNYIIGRCGGDEFNIIIPNGTFMEVKEFCKKVQEDCLGCTKLKLLPRMSFGFAKQEDGEKPSNTLCRADAMMYSNKTKIKKETDIVAELESKMYAMGYLDKADVKNRLKLALAFGLYLNLNITQLGDLAIAIKIEDLGMITVPEEIFFKQEPLSEAEIKEIHKHPDTGYRLAKLNDDTLQVAKTIHQCHENFDGTGYPECLIGENIDYLARIIFLVNGYTKALLKLKAKLEPEDAIKKALDDINKKKIYDPILTRQFTDYITRRQRI